MTRSTKSAPGMKLDKRPPQGSRISSSPIQNSKKSSLTILGWDWEQEYTIDWGSIKPHSLIIRIKNFFKTKI